MKLSFFLAEGKKQTGALPIKSSANTDE